MDMDEGLHCCTEDEFTPCYHDMDASQVCKLLIKVFYDWCGEKHRINGYC